MVKAFYSKIKPINKALFAATILALSLAIGFTDNNFIPTLVTVPIVLVSIHVLLTFPKQVAFTLVTLAQTVYIAFIGYVAGWSSFVYGGDLILPMLTLSFSNLTISLVIYFMTLFFVENKKWLVLLVAFIVADSSGMIISAGLEVPYWGTLLGGLLGVGVVAIKSINWGSKKFADEHMVKLERQLRVGLYNATASLVLSRRDIFTKTSLPGLDRTMLSITDNGVYFISTISPFESIEEVKGKGLMSGEIQINEFIGEHVKRATTYSNKNKINAAYCYPVILHSGNQYPMPEEGYVIFNVGNKKDPSSSLGTVIIATPAGLINFNDKLEKKIPAKVLDRLLSDD